MQTTDPTVPPPTRAELPAMSPAPPADRAGAPNGPAHAPAAAPASRPRSFVARKLAEIVEQAAAESGIACAIVLPSGEEMRFGSGAPQFTVRFHNERPLRGPMTEYALGKAYVEGDYDIDGDMWAMQAVRSRLKPRGHLGIALALLWQQFITPMTRANKTNIDKHYARGDDFYLTYIDKRFHFYSHCLFERDDETLEEAAEHKLESMWNGLQLKPGMRLLDIGGGWGPVHAYCGPRGVDVTSLTIADDSYRYISALDERLGLTNCRVRLEDFMVHEPAEPYDAIVIYGVIEHIPQYGKFAARVWDQLKPGGRLYLDASASIQKFETSDFISAYIWPGAHSFMCLQDVVGELLLHGMEVIETKNESRDYGITMRHWAERLEANKDFIIEKWGADTYRLWRVYLWTGSWAFFNNALQAYHVTAQKGPDRGPRPGVWKRTVSFVRGLK